jgi:5-(carboxyamino)imidazole ribonucleotide mutase
MPGGIPVGTLAVGKSGAINSALLAAAILGIKYPAIRESLRKFREAQTNLVLEAPDPSSSRFEKDGPQPRRNKSRKSS